MYLYFFIVWLAYLDSEAFGADKKEEAGVYNGFKDRDDDTLTKCEDVEDDQAEETRSVEGPEPGWG